MADNDNRRTTLKHVAEQSGYSLRTVKKVLGGHEYVSPKTRERVLAAAAELNYHRNNIASSLAKSKNAAIAILYAETAKTYFPEIERGFLRCAEECRDFGMTVEFYKTYTRTPADQIVILKELIDSGRVSGVVIQPMSRSALNPYIDTLTASGTPVITFGADASTDKRLCYIGPNAYKSGRIGGQILANYIGKRGNVVAINDNSEHMQSVDRFKGFADIINENYPDIGVIHLNIPDNAELYYEMVRALMEKESIQGIFCTDANSYIAGEVLRDLKITDTVVVGFDISQVAIELMRQGFLDVIIEQNPERIAYNALKAMFRYLYFDEKPEAVQWTNLSILTSECL